MATSAPAATWSTRSKFTAMTPMRTARSPRPAPRIIAIRPPSMITTTRGDHAMKRRYRRRLPGGDREPAPAQRPAVAHPRWSSSRPGRRRSWRRDTSRTTTITTGSLTAATAPARESASTACARTPPSSRRSRRRSSTANSSNALARCSITTPPGRLFSTASAPSAICTTNSPAATLVPTRILRSAGATPRSRW